MELNQSIENPLGAGTQVGQAEAFVYTPNQNVFSTIQGALDKNLQLQQADLAKKEEAKKKQDAALEKLMLDLQANPLWNRATGEMSNHIDDIQDFVINWRASGKPEDYNFQLELKKKMLDFEAMKSMNEKSFNEVSKYLSEATANEKLDKEDLALWQKGLDQQKDVESVYNYVFNQPKPGEYFDVLKPFKDFFSQEEQAGRTTKTDEKKQAVSEKAVWESRNPTERERMLRLAGRNLKLTDEEGNIRPATEKEFLDFVHEGMKSQYVKDVTPPPSSGGSSTKTKLFGAPGKMYGTSGDYNDAIGIASKKIQVVDNYNNKIEMIPSTIQYQGQPGEANEFGGMQIVGKKVGSTNTKTFTTKEEADAWASGEVAQGTIASDPSVSETGVVTYRTLEDVAVPYDWNIPVMNQNYPGLDPHTQMNPGVDFYYRRPLIASDDPRNFQ